MEDFEKWTTDKWLELKQQQAALSQSLLVLKQKEQNLQLREEALQRRQELLEERESQVLKAAIIIAREKSKYPSQKILQ